MPTVEHAVAGTVSYTVVNANKITFANDWPTHNLAQVVVPQLVGVRVEGQRFSGRVTFFKKAIPQLLAAFAEIEAKGLLHLILSYDGSYNPRPIRGSQNISNHALGLALDLNAAWNGLGRIGAPKGEKGSLAEIIPIFKKYGFGSGADYRKRKDFMHFECIRILTASEIAMLKGETVTAIATPDAVGLPPNSVIIVTRDGATRVITDERANENWAPVRRVLAAAGVVVLREGNWADGTPALFVDRPKVAEPPEQNAAAR